MGEYALFRRITYSAFLCSAKWPFGADCPGRNAKHSIRPGCPSGQKKDELLKRPLNKWFQRFGGTKFLKEILIKNLKYIKFKKVNVFLDKS
ncbi:hypothetical protein C3V36_05490 [Lachnospiraceae bacterium oral taxon 500]|nr:hypothetical protein C3V36_05490 [Lachnospiraceae bacterium oral taxon 500]